MLLADRNDLYFKGGTRDSKSLELVLEEPRTGRPILALKVHLSRGFGVLYFVPGTLSTSYIPAAVLVGSSRPIRFPQPRMSIFRFGAGNFCHEYVLCLMRNKLTS